jgi:hypothetical protein
MSSEDEILRFIGSSFRSVWALEVVLLLKREARAMTPADIVTALRASDLVLSKALDELSAGGFVSLEDGGVRYMPISSDVAECVELAEKLYAARPNSVRRTIVSSSASGASAFADAFRLRKD